MTKRTTKNLKPSKTIKEQDSAGKLILKVGTISKSRREHSQNYSKSLWEYVRHHYILLQTCIASLTLWIKAIETSNKAHTQVGKLNTKQREKS